MKIIFKDFVHNVRKVKKIIQNYLKIQIFSLLRRNNKTKVKKSLKFCFEI